MYRILGLSKSPLRNYSQLTNANNTILKPCQLCMKNRANQSTITSLNQKKERKKRTKNKKKFAELLIVTENSAIEEKHARVQKLTSHDLKLLANTSLNLSELHKLRHINSGDKSPYFVSEGHTYNNLGLLTNLIPSNELVIANLGNIVEKPSNDSKEVVLDAVKTEEDLEALEAVEEIELESIPAIIPNEVLEEEIEEALPEVEVKKDDREVRKEFDHRQKEEIATRSLAAFIEICNVQKHPQRGLNALLFHQNRLKKLDKNFVPLKSYSIYNTLLRGFSEKGDFDKITEVLAIMQEENVDLNVQSYIEILICLAKLNIGGSQLKNIRIFGKQAKYKGFTFSRMLNEGVFLNDDREIFLKAVKSYDNNFSPIYEFPNIIYDNHLVNQLNDIDCNYGAQFKLPGVFTEEQLTQSIDKQLDLEKNGYVTIKSIAAKENPSEEVLNFRETLDDHYKMWEESAIEAYNRDLATLTAQRSAFNYEPYLRCIPTKDYIAIILEEAKKLAQGSETYSPTVNMLYRDMGNKVYARYKILRKQKSGVLDKIIDIHQKYSRNYSRQHQKMDILPDMEVLLNTRQQWQLNEFELSTEGATLKMNHQEWVPTVLLNIGKFLYHIIMHDLKIDVNSMRANSKHRNFLPAFYTIFRTQGRMVKEEIKPHPILAKLYRASMPETLTFPTYEVPMLCPPIPWISTTTGGYLISPCDVIRLPVQASSQKQKLEEVAKEQIYPSLDALNQLAAVPWKVNEKILDVILEVFRNGGSSKLDVPEPPSSLPPPPSVSSEMDKSQRYQLFRQKLQHKRKKAEMYSLWCDCLYRLSLANHYRNDIFWLPHNMDFRGRVYPVPPHLNHLGSDLARSMLIFGESRPLGPDGLKWLKLHLINLTGLKKRDPVETRLKYADEIMDLILDSADHPLTGKRWWAESDEPWQTLACCMEVAAALRSENPAEFRSHFPIHQDGSCNGLQHYAALGRDSAGAFSVNLAPCDVPQDVYSAVATLVEEQRKKDAENGVEIAKVLEGFVRRKVIKQTVMTTVYGVTRFGARLQIARQLKDIDEFPKDQVWAGSSYLTGRTFDSLRSMFTSTREIQDWFTECARLISAVGGQHVEWVTPLGLPIVQPYFRYRKTNMPIYGSYPMDKYEKPNVMKQKNAFPPNFIHSLDSTHMMLTSLHCERAGITFVSVHDCYWTHPSTVHIMNKICREQFVALHSEPILEDLSLFLTDRYSYEAGELSGDGSVMDLTKRKLNRVLRKLPSTGNFDIKKVLDSVYFFS